MRSESKASEKQSESKPKADWQGPLTKGGLGVKKATPEEEKAIWDKHAATLKRKSDLESAAVKRHKAKLSKEIREMTGADPKSHPDDYEGLQNEARAALHRKNMELLEDSPGESESNPEPAGYDQHGRERAIVKAIQKVHGDEPVDDRGMMIERIAKESGLPHDEAWKTMLEMADRGALEFDPLGDTEAELSKQYGAKTYQPHHLRGKHANVVRLMKPHKLNVPLEKSQRSQYAISRESLRRFIA